jgi:hypothetical protein
LAGPAGESWTNNMTLTDVYENADLAHFSENHYTHWKPLIHTTDEVIACDSLGTKCNTNAEFGSLVAQYLR